MLLHRPPVFRSGQHFEVSLNINDLEQEAWITAMSVGSAWAVVLVGAYFSFQTGWHARGAEDAGGSVGRWMAYPVDEDGIPTTAPVTGRLVVDQVE